MANWIAEEWYRQAIAAVHQRRGRVVVFDRHFFCDYYAHDVVDRPGRSLASRVHGFNLRRLYPRPDLVVLLDAPATVLHARKGEGTVESIEARRREYLGQAGLFRRFAVVDASQPTEAVVAEVRSRIVEFVRGAPPVTTAAVAPGGGR
jgi:thymidylate kinase